MRWVIFDFAGVIGQHQTQLVRDEMVALTGVDSELFWAAYWEYRDPYDRGLVSGEGFWSAVAGALAVEFSGEVAAELFRLDITSWLTPDLGTVEVIAGLKGRGFGLALLSNAPHEVADALDGEPWMADLEHRFFSSRLGMSKPSADIYHAVLAALDAKPAECLFVDDRPPNVAAAEAVGMRALLFTDAGTLRADLAAMLP